MQAKNKSQAYYEIRVEGALGDIWENWFEGMKVRKEMQSENGLPVTVLYGPLPDQPALHGVIAKIRNLNLTLVSIQKMKGETNYESQ